MDVVVYNTRWRLIYLDGRTLDELPTGSTIMERWPFPVELQLIDLTGKAVLSVPLPPLHKPIFYRNRSIAQKPSGEFEEPRLDATVFGYGREDSSKFVGKLWVWE